MRTSIGRPSDVSVLYGSKQKELHPTKQLNKIIISETKDKTQDSLKTISLQNKTQTTKIKDLEVIQNNLEQKVNNLQLKIKDLEEREKAYLEAKELYEKNYQDFADKTYDTTQFLEE